MRYKAEVRVTLKPGVLDPQGATVKGALGALGYQGFEAVRVGKLIELWLEAASEEVARKQVEEVGRRLLANPVLETFTLHLEPATQAAGGGEVEGR